MLIGSLLCALASVAAASDVFEWTDANFDENVKKHEIVLGEFYAPWCGHCKKLAPEYEKAATKLAKNDPPVALAKVDCTVEKATCDKLGVSGFPTLKIFRNGELSSDYDGPREADGIVKFMRGQVGPSSKELKSLAELDKFIGGEEYSVVGFFKEESKLRDSFQKVADTERDRYRFAHTSDPKVIAKFGYTDDIIVFAPKKLSNKFEDDVRQYDGNYDTDKIKKFLSTEMHGLCGIRTRDTIASFSQPRIVVYYAIDYVKDPKGTQYWRNRVLKVASEFKRKLTFAVSDRHDFNHELEEYGLGDKKDVKDKPLVAAQSATGEKYPMTDEFSIENLQKFAQAVLDGKIEAYMKSEPIPEDNDSGVRVVVGKNFKDIVNQDKDVLVEFYAPWCGHCKKLTPIFDELAEKLADEDGVIIAKMDATANDVPPLFNVQGFPTLYFAKKDQKTSPVQYQGGRELDDFIKYLARESTNELKGWNRDGTKKKQKKEL
jgi:protein disulfide isomerase family A protein 3